LHVNHRGSANYLKKAKSEAYALDLSQSQLFERDREMLMKNESIPVEEKQQALALVRMTDEDKDRMDMTIDTK